jgi:hypothetical protein
MAAAGCHSVRFAGATSEGLDVVGTAGADAASSLSSSLVVGRADLSGVAVNKAAMVWEVAAGV